MPKGTGTPGGHRRATKNMPTPRSKNAAARIYTATAEGRKAGVLSPKNGERRERNRSPSAKK